MAGTFFNHYLKENKGDFYKFALVTRPFREPNVQDYDFIRHYSHLCGENGKVLVFLPNTLEEGHITPESTKEVLEIYCQDLENVIVAIAAKTPERSVKDFGNISFKYCNDKSQIYILAADRDAEDIQAKKAIQDYYKKNFADIYVIDPQATAFAIEGTITPRDFLSAIGDGKRCHDYMPGHLSEEDKARAAKLLSAAVN